MAPSGSVVHRRPEELYALARAARSRAEKTVRRAGVLELTFRAAAQRHQQAWARAAELQELWQVRRHDRLR